MKFLDSKSDISDLEKGVKNKFRFEWLTKDDFLKEKISIWCKKKSMMLEHAFAHVVMVRYGTVPKVSSLL